MKSWCLTNAVTIGAVVLGAGLQAAANETKAAPTDAEIAHIVVTADQVDINAGKVGESKAKSQEVKQFAKQMVTDHTAVNKQATELAKKLGVKPQDNPTSEALVSGGKENLARLNTLKGADFDKAYVNHEVTYHENVLSAIDQTLLPNAKNPELKSLIAKVRPAIVAHLDHAKHLQEQLSAK